MMVKPRIVETEEGIQGEFNVETYDRFMRGMRDRGWIETNLVLKAGITQGRRQYHRRESRPSFDGS